VGQSTRRVKYTRPGHVEDKVIDDLATWIAALRT